jgi:hypothetical protein
MRDIKEQKYNCIRIKTKRKKGREKSYSDNTYINDREEVKKKKKGGIRGVGL